MKLRDMNHPTVFGYALDRQTLTPIMIACYHCGKTIKGEIVYNNPPLYLIHLGLDFNKSYHPSCYVKAEENAALELQRKS